MMMHANTNVRPRAVLILVLAALWVAGAGCDNPFRPRVGYLPVAVEPPPRPTSPQGLMHLFQWCWVNRSIAEYEELFTEDFRFVFPDVEAVDNPPILRDEEVAIARRIFVDGSADEPRAKRVELTFVNEPLVPIPDTRPGKIDPWHKLVQSRVHLVVEIGDEPAITVDGDVNFYVVRGDSALIPPELRDRGFGPDPRRWYIERWEDKTGSATAAAVVTLLRELRSGTSRVSLPTARTATANGSSSALGSLDRAWSWGDLKRLYRDP